MGAGQKGIPLLYRHWHITLDLRRLDCASKQPKILSLEIAFRSLSVSLLVEVSRALSVALFIQYIDHFSFQFGFSFSGLVKEPSSLL